MSQPAGLSGRLERLSNRQRAACAVLAGASGALSLAPFDFWPLLIAAFAVLLALVATAAGPRVAGWTAWVGGTAWFALALHWIVEPFFVDAARHGWMAPFALVLLSGGLALFWALAGWGAARISQDRMGRLWLLAGLLFFTEYLRAFVLTGFPWAQPGHGLIASELLILSAFIGPHGMTAVALIAATLTAALPLSRLPGGAVAPVAIIGIAGVLPLTPPAPIAAADAPVIRLIQPNAPQDQKWLPEMIPVFFQRGLDLTAAPPTDHSAAPSLVIWPETSLPEILSSSEISRAAIAEASGAASVMVGAQRYEGVRPRNSAVLLDSGGAIRWVYDKHHLVPFGEYMPMRDVADALGLRGLAVTLSGGFAPGPGPALVDLGEGLGTAFPMICYEAIFPQYIRQVARPDWLLHLTNDAWFGEFSGPFQHLALARLRAAEQGLPLVRAANTGVSAVIDARGAIVASLSLGEAGYLDARLPPALPATLYARQGDWLALILGVLATAIGLIITARFGTLHPRP